MRARVKTVSFIYVDFTPVCVNDWQLTLLAVLAHFTLHADIAHIVDFADNAPACMNYWLIIALRWRPTGMRSMRRLMRLEHRSRRV